MSESVTVDLFTTDPETNEFVMYLVENGPWDATTLPGRLRSLQDRLYKTLDVAIDGHLANCFPESKGMRIRIQVDCHGNAPEEVGQFVQQFREHISKDCEYHLAIEQSQFIEGLRIVTRSEIRSGHCK